LILTLTRFARVAVEGWSSNSLAKKESGFFFKSITKPGVWLQNITTQEPDDSQLEVAIEALKESLKLEPQQQEAGMALLS